MHTTDSGFQQDGSGPAQDSTEEAPEPSGPIPQSLVMEDKPLRTRWVSVRFTTADLQDLSTQARQAGKSRSALIRQRALQQPVLSSTDTDTADSIDKLGRLFKHLYPKDKGWATPEDRRKFWRVLEDLQSTAAALRRRTPCSPKSSP
jgi:hypothetical protein